MKQHCRSFVLQLEEYLARHPDALTAGSGAVPAQLAPHAQRCRSCRQRWRAAAASRTLLSPLRPPGEPATDPLFYGRLRARIATLEATRWHPGWAEVRLRHLVLASVLFIAALGSFVYNLHRTETPNADEAMVLDVPHINPQHPADSHAQPRLADVMLNLMNP